MDDYVSRKEHEEFSRRIDEENERQNKRISLVEETVRQINDLTVSVKETAVNMRNMLEEQKKQGQRLETLEGRDGATWRTVVSHAITAVVGVAICYMMSKVGM